MSRMIREREYIAVLIATMLFFSLAAFTCDAYGATKKGNSGAVAEAELDAIILKPKVKESGDDLFRAYTESVLSSDSGTLEEGGGGQSKKTLRRNRLSDQEKVVYDILKKKIAAIAAGEDDYAVVDIPLATLGIMDSYTAEELGLDSIFEPDDMSQVSEEARQAVNSKLEVRLMSVLGAILSDFPYELYWYDKTSGIAVEPPKIIGFNNGQGGALVFDSAGKLTFKMYVAAAYSKTGIVQTVYTDTEKTAATVAAADRARAIVEKYKSLPDLEKLKKYKDEIITLTDYNYESVEEYQMFGIYGDPWQLIWVFDDDPETKVVCEGYSKAFQYLCDLTVFDNETIVCNCSTGDMYTEAGAGGPHMWNIVAIDGINYIVDLTNNDTVTDDPEKAATTYNDELFMAGAKGSFEEGYYVEWPNKDQGEDPYYILYIYDEETLRFFDKEELTIADLSYEEYIAEQNKPKIRVSITLLGDSYHRDDSEVHTLRAGNLEEWIPVQTYTVPEDCKVVYLVNRMLTDHGYSGNVKDGNYISSIGNKKDRIISEMDNGTYSGWMFSVNGKHINVGIGEKILEDGDEVVVHYTDDYRLEADDLDVSRVEALIRAIDALSNNVTLTDEKRVSAAADELDKLDKEEELLSKLVTSARRKKLADSQEKIRALKEEERVKAREDAAKALQARRISAKNEIRTIISTAALTKNLTELTRLSFAATVAVDNAGAQAEIDAVIAQFRKDVTALANTPGSSNGNDNGTKNESNNDGGGTNGSNSGSNTDDAKYSDKDKITPSDATIDEKAKVDKKLNIKASSIRTTAKTKKKTMIVKWKKVKGATNYRIAYKEAKAKKWKYKWSNGKTKVTLTKLKKNGLYDFKLQAVKKEGTTLTKSNWSRTNYRFFAKTTQKVKKGKKKAVVTVKKVKGASGYEVVYSLKKSMKPETVKAFKGGKKVKLTLKKLKSKKTYYIQSRPYRTYKGHKYIGVLSSTKRIKIKK